MAATITVNSAADVAVSNDDLCTLREAINSANTNIASGGVAGECAAGQSPPTLDTIAFSVSGTISPASPMPQITQIVKIDGYTVAGAHPNTLAVGNDAVLAIEINGTNVVGDLFTVAGAGSSGSTLRGLVINRLAGSAISIVSSDTNTLSGNFFGTDTSGSIFQGTLGTPIQIRGVGNVIGGLNPGDRNVIVGGTSTILLVGPSGGSLIEGNYIGVNASGTAALQPAVATTGIELISCPNNTIGGTAAGAGNVIVGTALGIRVGAGGSSTNTLIQGNFIGTNATGTAGLGGRGISTDNGASNLTIGGAAAGAGNLISGGTTAISLGDSSPPVTIQGNKIGTDVTGTHPIINAGDGISIAIAGTGSLIGGTGPGEGNTIAYNCGRGVWTTTHDWPILGNSIFSNGGLGITLTGTDTPTQNDAGDGDTGPNNLQNYPVITSAPITSGIATISGTLNSVPNTAFRIEFFASDRCDPSGFGEGRNFIGFTPVTTDNNGNASFGPLPEPVSGPGVVLTATATDPAGNTSEFSQCFGIPDHLFADGFEPTCPGS